MARLVLLLLSFLPQAVQAAAPTISLQLGGQNYSEGVTVGVQVLILLTILSVAPSILLMSTCFVRFIIVFGMLRTAMGIGQLPPTQVLVGLSLILTFVVMQPTFDRINTEALKPFLANQIDEQKFVHNVMEPMRDFMGKQTGPGELTLAYKIVDLDRPDQLADVPPHILMMAYMLSELKKAFQIGFMMFLPFIIIDMVVGTALVSVGLMFLPPTTVSLPFKIVLFILIDGWNILSEGLMRGVIGPA